MALAFYGETMAMEVAVVVARRRGGGSGGATPDPLPPATLPAFDLCFSAPAPPTIPPSHRCFADIVVRSQGMGLTIQQLTRHAEGGSAP